MNEKNFLKKVLKIGGVAAVLATSSPDSNAQVGKTDSVLKKENNIEFTTDTTLNEKYRKDYLEYMEHPSYKERLKKEMYGDTTLTPEMELSIENEYKNRIHSIQTAQLDIKELERKQRIFNIEDTYTSPNEKGSTREGDSGVFVVEAGTQAAYHELSHTTERNGSENSNNTEYLERGFTEKFNKVTDYQNTEYYDSLINKWDELSKPLSDTLTQFIKNKLNNNIEIIDPRTKEVLELNRVERLLMALESNPITIAMTYFPNESFVTKEIKDIYEKVTKEEKRLHDSKEYFSNPTEIKARFNNLRLKAVKEYGYDLNTPFNIADYPELMKDVEYNHLRYYLKLTDDKINELMNYIASADKISKYQNQV